MPDLNKTKIVATLGPASSSEKVLKNLFNAGVNVCRINFSHGSYEQHQETINTINKLNAKMNKFVAILADLQGPKIRIGEVENNGIDLIDGNEIEFTTKEIIGNEKKVYITYENFPKDVSAGETILLDDGKLQLEIVSTNHKDLVKAKVLHGGILSSKKGVNLPNTVISLPCLTEKDKRDLDFALKNKVHWVGLSFVRNPKDIEELRSIITKKGVDSRIIAKIEKPEAVKNLDEIIEISDGIMVARGDLGVEIPMQNVPLVQKTIVKKCRKAAKPVIIATQMMETMIESITPTRAEVNDVANAIMDGADAVMLSGETSIGKYPVEVVQNMTKIITQTETFGGMYYKDNKSTSNEDRFISDVICETSTSLARKSKAKGIVTMTFSGYTAFKISSFRPKADIFVFTGNPRILATLNLVWGVRCFYYDKFVSTDHTINDIKYILKKEGYVIEGDFLINIASMPIVEKGMSNMLKLSMV